ncbi:DUF309 domain-containing protein [Tomitella fengzijianii]|uniref:DUF309 domain-containing protein n=1 Tax=Tomitella fengzijianii TaxID=2597660 RepID=UPI001E4BEEB5|nr:DUF309 domain-containing protein [Tomitella fengzijianii]
MTRHDPEQRSSARADPTPRRRARDARGRAQNDRPRDALGRPLPHGATGVPRQPEGIARTPEETLDLGQDLLDHHRPFHAHDVFEDHWKQTAGADKPLWRGLAQLAVGITHAARGNPAGAAAVLDRAATTISPFAAAPPFGVDVPGIRAWCADRSARLDSARSQPEPTWLEPPRLQAGRQDGFASRSGAPETGGPQ